MKKIWSKIVVAFSSVGVYFNQLWVKAKAFLNKEIPIAVAVVEQLKKFVDSPILPVLTDLIPGEVDDVIAAKIKQCLPVILVELKIAGECANLSTNDAIIQCALNHLKSLEPLARRGKYLDIASTLSEVLADGKLTWPEIVLLVQSLKNPELAKP